jgi:hypothetical protein
VRRPYYRSQAKRSRRAAAGYEPPSSAKTAEVASRFETILGFGFSSGTATDFKLPDGEPMEIELELTKTEVDGRAMPLKLTPAAGFVVEPSGRKATWSTKLPQARVEAGAAAELPNWDPKPACKTKLPVTIEGTWTAVYGGKWEIESPTSGTLSLAPPAVEAFVDCGPSMPIVGGQDGE